MANDNAKTPLNSSMNDSRKQQGRQVPMASAMKGIAPMAAQASSSESPQVAGCNTYGGRVDVGGDVP